MKVDDFVILKNLENKPRDGFRDGRYKILGICACTKNPEYCPTECPGKVKIDKEYLCFGHTTHRGNTYLLKPDRLFKYKENLLA